jgi:hypothetical protein
MGIADVRAGLETVLAGVDGVRSASGWPKENVGPPVACYVGFDDDVIIQGASELDLHQLPIYVFVQQTGGNLKNELIATEGVITAVRDALRANNSLGGVSDHVRVLRIQEGVYEHAGQPHVGFIMDIEVKERRNVGA